MTQRTNRLSLTLCLHFFSIFQRINRLHAWTKLSVKINSWTNRLHLPPNRLFYVIFPEIPLFHSIVRIPHLLSLTPQTSPRCNNQNTTKSHSNRTNTSSIPLITLIDRFYPEFIYYSHALNPNLQHNFIIQPFDS